MHPLTLRSIVLTPLRPLFFFQSSYNFRTYFLRRSRDLFRSNLLPESEAGYSSPFSKASGRTTRVSPATLTSAAPNVLSSSLSASGAMPDDRLAAFYQAAKKDLDVLRRAALTNRMYEGERLVVEKPQLIVGGGGAGAEASTGGAGQPVSAPQSKGGAPPSNDGSA